jgi:hypothetical protein
MHRMASQFIRQTIGQILAALWPAESARTQAQLVPVRATQIGRKQPFALRGGGLKK